MTESVFIYTEIQNIYQNMESQVKLYRTLYKYSKYSSLIKCGNRLCLCTEIQNIYCKHGIADATTVYIP
jgi:hypothetical protein